MALHSTSDGSTSSTVLRSAGGGGGAPPSSAAAAPAPAAAAPVVKAEPGLNGAEPMATDEPKKDDDKMDEG